MSARVGLSPAALEDLREAAQWYDGQDPGLAGEFLRAVDACLSRIERLPQASPEAEGGVRSARLSRFPYAVLYRVRTHRIEVLAVWHAHRDPRGWRERT